MKSTLLIVVLVAVAVAGKSVELSKSQRGAGNGRRVVCYYGSWAVYRPDLGKFDVEQIDPMLCTHGIYGFAGLSASNDIISLDTYNDLYDNYGKGAFERFTGLTSINPDFIPMLAIGGWNEGSSKYSAMANDPTQRAHFVSGVVPFLSKYGFKGLDVDWEYPTQRGGVPSDRQAYVDLLRDLKSALSAAGMILSVAVSSGKATIDPAYDIPAVASTVDMINLMTYDFHGSWEPFTGHNTPLNARAGETADQQTLNVAFAANYWLQGGAPASLINLGMALYGHNYALADVNKHGLYDSTYGPGDAGPYTRQGGTLGYNEICVDLNNGGWSVVIDPDYQAPYAYQGNQWISYDDVDSIATKCNLANQLGLGGGMVWSIETDDFQPSCGSQNFPLLRKVNEMIRNVNPSPPPPRTTVPYTGAPTTERTTLPPVTSPPPDPTAVCQRPGFQADPNDCTTFYQCIDNGAGGWTYYTFHCGPGTIFDPAIDSCNYPYNVPDCHANI